MATPPVGIQPIIFKTRTMEEPQVVLDEIREAGYDGVEAPNLTTRYDVKEVKRWFVERALVVPATHGGYGVVSDPEQLAKTMDYLNDFGGRYVICSGTKDRTLAGYQESAAVMNEIGAACKARDLQFLYHNHAWEFEDLGGGQRGIDILIEQTDPAVVGLNIDVYWVHIGGDDPAAFVRKHGARAEYFHFKDGGKDAEGKPAFSELGQGEVDLKSALEAALEVGATWITYEQDRTDRATIESITMSRQCLKALGV